MKKSAQFILENQVRQQWPLTHVLASAGAVIIAYLLTLQAIRIYMRNREPFNLKTALFWYNLGQVILSVIGLSLALPVFYNYGFNSIGCIKETVSVEWANYYVFITDVYTFYKHLDLLDTIFFALRKRDNQISFLHVYHHCAMIGWGWIVSFYVLSDHHVVPAVMNTTIHCFMYSYYLIASLGPDYAKYIWWKKHLTKLQLVQFVGILTHVTYQQFVTSCPVPTFVYFYSMANPIIFFILFLNFYFKSYRKVKKVE